MLSEEEKKAIEILINEIADIVVGEYCTHCKICENEDTECYYTKAIDTVYNLINKQQEEIDTHIETENDYEHELARKDEEIEKLKKHYEMATRIIEEYADEVEKDTLKIENYRHKNIK